MVDDITVESAGMVLSGWTAVSAERGIDRAAGSFRLDVPRTRRHRGGAAHRVSPLRPGDGVRVRLGDDLVLSGYVDLVTPRRDEQTDTLSISGRGVTADLIDCSAMNEPGQWQATTLMSIVQAIVRPFGLSARSVPGLSAHGRVDNFELEAGETAFRAIERLARLNGLVVHDDAAGNIVLARPGDAPAVSSGMLRHLDGPDGGPDPENNVLESSAVFSAAGRFSQIVVQGQDVGRDTTFGRVAAAPQGRAVDADITRYRPLVIQAEGRVNDAGARLRAEWEVSRRAGRALTLTHLVRGWRTSATGDLWQPGTRVPVRDVSAGVFRDMLVVEARWHLADAGRLTTLVLQPPEAFTPRPVVREPAGLGQWDTVRQQVQGT